MALFIRDAEVDALAEEVRKLTKAKTKTEAVRRALQAQLAEARRALPLKERLARSKALADAMGPGDPDFDMRAYTDEMWGEA
jgi:antitoxin VapB